MLVVEAECDIRELLRRYLECAGLSVLTAFTARSTTEDRIRGLELGADDYFTTPFSPHEILLRVLAVLHRLGRPVTEVGTISFGENRLRIDENSHRAWLDDGPLDLTHTEWGLIAAVASAPGCVYSRYELVHRVRGFEYEGYERTIDSHIENFRRKLGPRGADVVETVLGVGYRLGLSKDLAQ